VFIDPTQTRQTRQTSQPGAGRSPDLDTTGTRAAP
jgi:hypothetical protein